MVDLGLDSTKPFLVIGRAGMDLYPTPINTKTADATEFVSALGGSSANIAVALCRLGQRASLVTCISDDAIGSFVENQLKHYGVDSRFLRKVNGDCRASLAIVESRVEDHQSVIYRNNAADFQMDQGDFVSIKMSEFSAMIITGTCLTSNPSRQATLGALALAKQSGLLTIMDLDYRPYSWETESQASEVYNEAVDLVDVVVGNDEEFGHMAGGLDFGEGFARSLASLGKLAIYKMGGRGSQAFLGDEIISTDVFPVTPIKPTGAGDAFLGAVLAGLSSGEELARSLVYGSASAAIVVTRVGCAPAMPTLRELNLFVEEHEKSVKQTIGRM